MEYHSMSTSGYTMLAKVSGYSLPFLSLLSFMLPAQDVKHMLSHCLGSLWTWKGTKGFSGVTSSPCGLPQPPYFPSSTPSPTQCTELLSPPHLVPEH